MVLDAAQGSPSGERAGTRRRLGSDRSCRRSSGRSRCGRCKGRRRCTADRHDHALAVDRHIVGHRPLQVHDHARPSSGLHHVDGADIALVQLDHVLAERIQRLRKVERNARRVGHGEAGRHGSHRALELDGDHDARGRLGRVDALDGGDFAGKSVMSPQVRAVSDRLVFWDGEMGWG